MAQHPGRTGRAVPEPDKTKPGVIRPVKMPQLASVGPPHLESRQASIVAAYAADSVPAGYAGISGRSAGSVSGCVAERIARNSWRHFTKATTSGAPMVV